MNPVPRTPMSNTAKWALGLFVAFGAIRVIDFIFYGQQMRDLLAGTGLLLIAYGIYKNGFRSTDFHTAGRYASIAGTVLVLAAIAMRFWR